METDDELTKAIQGFKTTGLRRISGAMGAIGKRGDAYKHSDAMAPLRVPIVAFGAVLLTSFVVLTIKGFWWAACFPAVVLLGILVFYALVYWHWMKNDPDRLQTESFRIDSQLLGIFAEKGLPTSIAVALADEEGEADEPEPGPMLASKKARQLVLDVESKTSESKSKSKSKSTKVDREKE